MSAGPARKTPGAIRLHGRQLEWIPILKSIYEFESSLLSKPGSWRTDINDVLWDFEQLAGALELGADGRKPYVDLIEWLVQDRQAMVVAASGKAPRYITRVAETVRLLGHTHEYWYRGRAATEAVRWLVEDKRVPKRDISSEEFERTLAGVIETGVRTDWRVHVLRAMKVVVKGVAEAIAIDKGLQNAAAVRFSGFQLEATREMILSEFGQGQERPAQVITAGVGSGKTYAFLIPTLISALAGLYRGEDGRRTSLLVYPRKALARNQYNVLIQVVAHLNSPNLVVHFDHIDHYLQNYASVKEGLAKVYGGIARPPAVIITTLETLKRRLNHPGFMAKVPVQLNRVILDEVHLVEGLGGAHVVRLMDRLRAASQSKRPNVRLLWTASSATVAGPHVHAATLFNLQPAQVKVISPSEEEMETVGIVHHVFLRPTGNISSLGTLVNLTSVLVHNRRPGLGNRSERKSDSNQKTIAFADNLDLLGRWNADLRENERTESVKERPHPSRIEVEGWTARQREVPYAIRFSRPLDARIEANKMEPAVLQRLRGSKPCQACQDGKALSFGEASAEEFSGLSELVYRRPIQDKDELETFHIENPQVFDGKGHEVGTLNLCPYLRAGACFWFPNEDASASPIPHTNETSFEWANVARSKIHTAKTAGQSEGSWGDLEDVVFSAPVSEVYDVFTDKIKDIPVDMVLASPSLEVGIDLSNLTESVMFHAIRNVASYRQKAGRIGREEGSDSMNVSLMANRPIDLHYYRQPRKLVSLAQLDPIPLKVTNESVLRNALYCALWDWLALYADIPEVIPLDVSNGQTSFAKALDSSLQKLRKDRGDAERYLSNVSRNLLSPASTDVQQAIAQVDSELSFLLTDVRETIVGAENLADLVPRLVSKGPHVSLSAPATELLRKITMYGNILKEYRSSINPVDLGLSKEFQEIDLMARCGWSLDRLKPTLDSLASAADHAEVISEAIVPLQGIRRALEAWGKDSMSVFFFLQFKDYIASNPSGGYYLSSIMQNLPVFRMLRRSREMVRLENLFTNPYEEDVEVDLRDKSVGLSEALFSLIPGTWTYRFGKRPVKTASGMVEPAEGGVLTVSYQRLTTPPINDLFEKVKVDVPGPPGLNQHFDVMRPIRLHLITFPEKYVKLDPASGTVLDADEAGRREGFPRVKIPKSYLNRWVHVDAPEGKPVEVCDQDLAGLVVLDPKGVVKARGKAAAAEISHPFAASLLSRTLWHPRLDVTEFVYSVSRSYTNTQMSGVDVVFEGPERSPMAFGKTLETEGISFELKPDVVKEVQGRVLEAMRGANPAWAPTAIKGFASYLTALGMDAESRASPFVVRDLVSLLATSLSSGGGEWSPNALAQELHGLAEDRPKLERLARDYYTRASAMDASDAESIGGDQAWEEAEEVERRVTQLADVAGLLSKRLGEPGDYLTSWVVHALLNSFGTSAMNALQRVAGVTENVAGYAVDYEGVGSGRFRVFLYDKDHHGNGSSAVAGLFYHILHIQRHGTTTDSRLLPSDDFLSTLEEELLQCAQYHTDSSALEMLDQSRKGDVLEGVPMLGYVRDGAREVLSNSKETWESLGIVGRADMWKLPIFRLQVAALKSGRNLEVDDLIRATTVCWNGCPECLLNRESQTGGLAGEYMLDKAILDEWFRSGRSKSREYVEVELDRLAAGKQDLPFGRLSSVAIDLPNKRVRSVSLPYTIGIELPRMGGVPHLIVRISDIEGMSLFESPTNLPALGIESMGFKRLFWNELVMTAYMDLLGLIPGGRRQIKAVFYDCRDIGFEDSGVSSRMLDAIVEQAGGPGRLRVPEKLSDLLVWFRRRGYEVSLCVDLSKAREPSVKKFLATLKGGGCRIFTKDLGTALMHKKAMVTPLGAIEGSANLTERGTLSNEEIVNYAQHGHVSYDQVFTAVTDTFQGATEI